MDSAFVYNLPLYFALALTAMKLTLTTGVRLIAWQTTPGNQEREHLVQTVVKQLNSEFSYVRPAALSLLLIQTLIWAAAPVASSFFTTLNRLFSHPWMTAIYST